MNTVEIKNSGDGAFQNTLEQLLADSAKSEASRPYFYRELLASTVYICPHEPVVQSNTAERESVLKLATIAHEGVNYVPFFTSPRYAPQGTAISQIPARVFFEVIKGSSAVINPGYVPMKTFTPSEIERLLSGAILAPEKQFEVKSGTRAIIGQPSHIPPRLIEQLSEHFSRNDQVIRAWLGWYHNPETEAKPGYLLAVETRRSQEFERLAGMISLVIKEVGIGTEYCDIVRYTNSGITNYFSPQRPFYSMSLGQRILARFL
jgi:hypothetical protein